MENLINQLTSTHDKDAQVKLLQEKDYIKADGTSWNTVGKK